MSYSYANERPRLFTEDGQVFFLKVRDATKALIAMSGAFRFDKLSISGGYDSWELMAAIDRLVELGELEECQRPSWAQFKVYSTPQRDNR